MNTLDMNVSGDDSQRAGRVYLMYGAKLYGNSLSLLGDASEADECVRETFRHFFLLMKDLRWEADAEAIDTYLMRISGGVSSRRLAEKRRLAAALARQEAEALALQESESLLNKLRREALRPVEQLAQFKQLFVRTFGVVRQPKLKQLSAIR